MSSPIEKRKEQLKAMLKFDAKEARDESARFIDSLGNPNIDYKPSEVVRLVLHIASWQHTKTAQIAQDLLDALEALEYYANQSNYEKRETMGGARPPAVLVERGSRASAVLAKLSKGDE